MIFEEKDVDIHQAPISLFAYIGDAVMSLYYKLKLAHLMKPSRIEKEVRKIISREGQAELLDKIWNVLTEDERALAKRAMNSKSATKHGNDPLYRKSTGLEALVGYLYLAKKDSRLKEILDFKIFRS